MKRIFVAVPARDGRITAPMALSLMGEAGPDIEIQIAISRISGIHFARDQLANDFLASDADRMVFVDEDISWEPGELCRLASHDVDLCGGAYRLKQDIEHYPVRWLTDGPAPSGGLIEVKALPTGFMSISRKVFETMMAANPARKYTSGTSRYHGFFCMPYGGGEDIRFCTDWRELGGKVWLDPDLKITHNAADKSYPGHVGNWLRAQSKLENVA